MSLLNLLSQIRTAKKANQKSEPKLKTHHFSATHLLNPIAYNPLARLTHSAPKTHILSFYPHKLSTDTIMDTDDNRSTTTTTLRDITHTNTLSGFNFQVSNPSEVPLDPDSDSSPGEPRHVPPAVVVDKQHRRWQFHAKQQPQVMTDSDAWNQDKELGTRRGGKRKRRSDSPSRHLHDHTAAQGLHYPARCYCRYNHHQYYGVHDEEEEIRGREAPQIANPSHTLQTNPPTMSVDPSSYPYPYALSQRMRHQYPYTNHPRERDRGWPPDDVYHVAQRAVKPVTFADIRPLTIRRRTAAVQALALRQPAEGAPRDPYSYSTSTPSRPYISQQPSLEHLPKPARTHAYPLTRIEDRRKPSLLAPTLTPEWMRREESVTYEDDEYSRGGAAGVRYGSRPGRMYSGSSSSHLGGSNVQNQRTVIRNSSFYSNSPQQYRPVQQQRRPQIRLAVHGLSYVNEGAEHTIQGPEERINEQRVVPDNPPSLLPDAARSGMSMYGAPYSRAPSFSYPHTYPYSGMDRRWPKEVTEDKEGGVYLGPARKMSTVSQQPQRHPGMRLGRRGKGGGNRNAKCMPVAADGTRDWSTDLCLFCDHNLGTCCKALWCPCIVYGRNKARIEYLYAEQTAHPTKGGPACSGDCAIHACLTTFCLFGWAIQIPNRASVRRRYNIEGDWLGDCAAALFCSPCELSQESREIDLEEQSFFEETEDEGGGMWGKR
ncbi:Cell number regulator 11 [Psilocybe cubensis]|uniref:Cell number regulator 11 n=2 Tax=Psilocybe cubensis TaxID=181762 RepID=A0ACB8GS42_PSICU|nr:Cell number regulator 11 [Psilocybe cubensis]KAH9478046.1 Cell number regulator 11 [Psilocybe cubensis]